MAVWSIRRLNWELRRRYQQHGWPVFAIPVALFATLVFASEAIRLDRQATDLELVRVAKRPELPTRPIQQQSAEALAQFYQGLPGENERFSFVKSVLLAADEHDVLPPSADYKLQREPHTRIVRYRLNLPIEGRWQDIQDFLKAVLNKHRNAAIDSLKLKRHSASAHDVEGSLRISILMRQQEIADGGELRPAQRRQERHDGQ